MPGLTEIVRALLHLQGWRDEDGAGFDEHSLWHALHPLLSQAEGYGLVRSSRGADRLTLELTGRTPLAPRRRAGADRPGRAL